MSLVNRACLAQTTQLLFCLEDLPARPLDESVHIHLILTIAWFATFFYWISRRNDDQRKEAQDRGGQPPVYQEPHWNYSGRGRTERANEITDSDE
jgi:hypothetical protein